MTRFTDGFYRQNDTGALIVARVVPGDVDTIAFDYCETHTVQGITGDQRFRLDNMSHRAWRDNFDRSYTFLSAEG